MISEPNGNRQIANQISRKLAPSIVDSGKLDSERNVFILTGGLGERIVGSFDVGSASTLAEDSIAAPLGT